jgi:hypothetical protein
MLAASRNLAGLCLAPKGNGPSAMGRAGAANLGLLPGAGGHEARKPRVDSFLAGLVPEEPACHDRQTGGGRECQATMGIS